jgi:hypothetical protein
VRGGGSRGVVKGGLMLSTCVLDIRIDNVGAKSMCALGSDAIEGVACTALPNASRCLLNAVCRRRRIWR